MMLNKTREKTVAVAPSHPSNEGRRVFTPSNPLTTLRMAASSCFFGEPKFYQDRDKAPAVAYYGGNMTEKLDVPEWGGKSPRNILEAAIEKALNYDVEGTLKEAVRLRNEAFIRVTPQVILVMAAHHQKAKGTGLITKYAPEIIKRSDEPATGLAYHKARYKGKPLPNSLKKAWKNYLQNQDDYSLAKYRMESREVKTVDVVNMVHAYSPSIDKLMKGTLTSTGETWESIISAGGDWEEAISKMGHMALLRNLRNFHQKNVNPKLYLQKLIDTAEKGKQLPFRYLSAYDELQKVGGKPQVLDGIEEALERSLGSLPHFDGRVISITDNSGSMWSASPSLKSSRTLAEIGNVMGVISGKLGDEGYTGIFGTTYKTYPVRKKDSIFSQLAVTNREGRQGVVGHGTNITPFFNDSVKKNDVYDHIFIYSDMQVASSAEKSIKAYREKVNPKVLIYLVQVAGYTDTLMPEFYNRSFVMGGWSDSIIRFAGEMAELYK